MGAKAYAMKVIIHINRHIMGKNAKAGTNEPAIIVRTYKGVTYHNEVQLCCPKCKQEVAKIVQPGCTLSGCGARIWITSESEAVNALTTPQTV